MSPAVAPAPLSPPWWWSAVETYMTDPIGSLAATLRLSEAVTAQRVWAALGLMLNPRFPVEPLVVLFPEVDVSNTSPSHRRAVFVKTINEKQEPALARIALERLSGGA